MATTYSLELPRTLEAPAQARDALTQLEPSLPEHVIPDMTLLVSELITNSVKYGRGPITLELHAPTRDRLLCEVADAGAGFTPEARTRPATDVGGWGLYLVEALASNWGVYDGSTHVWFEVSASPDEQ